MNVTMYRFIFLLQAIVVELCAAKYVLETSYTSANWFNQFSFFTVRCLFPCRAYHLTGLTLLHSQPILLLVM